jgi:ribonuclease D
VFYAALDVEYLQILVEKLITNLQEKNRLDWVIEEGETIFKNHKQLQNPDRVYLKIKSAWKLSKHQLDILKRLSRWRENQAQMKDIPRNQLLKEASLYQLSLVKPSSSDELKAIDGLSEKFVRRYGEEIIQIVQEVNALPENELPSLLPKPLNKNEQGKLKALREYLRGFSELEDVAPEILLKKKDYEQIIRYGFNSDGVSQAFRLKGWRKDFLEAGIEDYFQSLTLV